MASKFDCREVFTLKRLGHRLTGFTGWFGGICFFVARTRHDLARMARLGTHKGYANWKISDEGVVSESRLQERRMDEGFSDN
jgi:hypothetical protein